MSHRVDHACVTILSYDCESLCDIQARAVIRIDDCEPLCGHHALAVILIDNHESLFEACVVTRICVESVGDECKYLCSSWIIMVYQNQVEHH